MFYTYFHTRNDTQKPFYVGKGSGNRAYDSDRSTHWRSIVAKHGHTVHIAAEWPTEYEAFEHEKFLILCFKDMGLTLCNRTFGGEGTVGWIPTIENRKTTSEVTKRRWADPAYKARVSEAIKIGSAAPGVSERRSKSVEAALARPEVKEKLSAAQKRLWQDPAHREKVLASRASNKETDEAKALRLAKTTAAQRTPEARARRSAQSKAFWADPQNKARTIEASRRAITPATLEQASIAMKALWKTPEYLEKMKNRGKKQ